MKRNLLFLLLLTAVVAGCGRRYTVIDQPTVPPAGHYEITWVNPEYYYTDTLITLLRAERVDSFYVDRSNPLAPAIPSISFHVEAASCIVAVNVFDEYSRLATPILVRTLPAGYYKLTLHSDQFDRASDRSSSASLRADICGSIIVEPFVFE